MNVNVTDEQGTYLGVVLPIDGGWTAGHDDVGLGVRRARRAEAVADVHHFNAHGRFPGV